MLAGSVSVAAKTPVDFWPLLRLDGGIPRSPQDRGRVYGLVPIHSAEILRMDVTPELHLMDSKESENVGWHDALAELIDNSLDAGAMRVEIALNGKRLAVKDDGTGVKSIESLVKFGSHKPHKTTSLGRYGVGLKDAWMYFGPRICVETVCGGTATTLELDRSQIKMIDGRWVAPDPVSTASNMPTGTVIAFDPLKSDRRSPQLSAIEKLGWTFMPAIQDGRQIIYTQRNKRIPVKAFDIPALCERIETRFDVGGKTVELIAGVMQEGARNPYPSLWISYGHRIVTACTIGCGNYSAAKIAGVIRLGHGWKLTPHKNDLAELTDELDQAIFGVLEPMLQRASKLIEDIASNQLRTQLEASLNSALAGAKAQEKRNPPSESTGTVKPTGGRGPRKHAEKFDITKLGSVQIEGGKTRARRGVKVDWCNIDPERIGQYDPIGNVVMLNLDNQFIAHAKNTDNQEALRTVAIGLLCHHCCNNDKSQRLLIEKRDFIASWGLVMASLKFEEKRRGK